MNDESVEQLKEEIHTELRREVESVRYEMQQIRDLVQDAIVRLTDSFNGLREQSDQQLALVTTLTSSMDEQTGAAEEESKDEEKISISSFINETDKVLHTFIDHIVLVSRQSMEMVFRIEELDKQMSEVMGFLKDINAIAELTNVLSLNARIISARSGTAGATFSVVAGEVRNLARKSHVLSDKIGVVVGNAKNNIDTTKKIIEVMASKDMNFAIEAKGRADLMINEVKKIDEYTQETIEKVSGIADELGESVGNAVMSLQFEDMVTQLAASAERKFAVIDQFTETVNVAYLCDQNLEMEERIAMLRNALEMQIGAFDEVDRQAVQQSSMDEGDIELF